MSKKIVLLIISLLILCGGNNKEKTIYEYYVTVDDVDTRPMYKHVVSQITDKLDPNYGQIFVEREPIEVHETPDISIFNDWELDTALFPDITMHKIRYKVSGKGYGGSVKILSKNTIPFELLHISWVYRVMFAR